MSKNRDKSPVLFQVSTSGALARGLYRGALTLKALLKHGDLGLGTFHMLDGEMMVIDGRVYQVRSDGSVRKAGRKMTTPFAMVVPFGKGEKLKVGSVPDLARLEKIIDGVDGLKNRFLAIRIDGEFNRVRTRVVPRQKKMVPLAEVAEKQPEFEYEKVFGTLAGFRSPEFLKNVTIPGYHLHFLDDSRTHGGHVLACSVKKARITVCGAADFQILLPRNREFLAADLALDMSGDLERAEKGRGGAK